MHSCLSCLPGAIRASRFGSPVAFIVRGSTSYYRCHVCGRRWNSRDQYQYWPIRVRVNMFALRDRWFHVKHTFAGYADHNKQLIRTFIHIGRLTIIVGTAKRTWQKHRFVSGAPRNEAA